MKILRAVFGWLKRRLRTIPAPPKWLSYFCLILIIALALSVFFYQRGNNNYLGTRRGISDAKNLVTAEEQAINRFEFCRGLDVLPQTNSFVRAEEAHPYPIYTPNGVVVQPYCPAPTPAPITETSP